MALRHGGMGVTPSSSSRPRCAPETVSSQHLGCSGGSFLVSLDQQSAAMMSAAFRIDISGQFGGFTEWRSLIGSTRPGEAGSVGRRARELIWSFRRLLPEISIPAVHPPEIGELPCDGWKSPERLFRARPFRRRSSTRDVFGEGKHWLQRGDMLDCSSFSLISLFFESQVPKG